MHEYVHMNPNFGKYKLIPVLLLIPVVAFLIVFVSSKRKVDEVQKVASATVAPTPVQNVVTINDISVPVQVVDTEIKRREGLSNKPPLEEGHGMLFVFPNENVRGGFWMKEMYFDIDIIWINDGEISQIHENVPAPENPNAPAHELPLYIPNDPYDFVLEMNAGSANKYGFEVGDQVTTPTP